jgi:hypothetical protein
LGPFIVPALGQNCGRTGARSVGNEFVVLDMLASKINVSLVRRSVVIRVD